MTSRWGRFEIELCASTEHDDPVSGVRVQAEFVHESGERRTAQGFWDGGRDWLVRFSPDLAGKWTWQSHCAEDEGLDGGSGEFDCVAGAGGNPLHAHGAIRVAESGSYFEHADGTPFFWLGDTAWNGPLKSTAEEWETYLEDRAAKGFNVVQFVATQWLAAAGDAAGRRAYNGTAPLHIDPVFFRRLDRRVDAINQHGMIAAPVLAWAAGWNKGALDLNPGASLPDAQIVALARYIVARYGAHHAVWILAGDADYLGAKAERWRKIGRAVFEDGSRLATMHPGGRVWVAEEFSGEPWFRFNGYQSGHWREDSERWITHGPPAKGWQAVRRLPHVNLEFCYEAHEDFIHHRRFDMHDIRRRAWWSVLAAPPAGLSYGCHGIWSWEAEPAHPMNHPNTGVAPVWRDALDLPGSKCMQHLREILARVEWWRLAPCEELVSADAARGHIAAAKSANGDVAVVYLAEGGAVRLHQAEGLAARCFDPATGRECAVLMDGDRFDSGGPGDRVLVLTKETTHG
ncbi:MAG: DUF4038 domain-containing protein [Candidatus Solibacter sp.]|nr:DUF4038 domain-containing protein [Candidatus Solibacter sp.]